MPWIECLLFQRYLLWIGKKEEPLPTPLALPHQVHGTTVVDADGKEGDGIFTDEPHRWIGVQTADCLPIVFLFEQRILVLHAGWRGLSQGILQKSRTYWQGQPWLVFIGPAIGPCCYRVGEELAPYFPGFLKEGYLDLRGFAVHQLKTLGLPEKSLMQLPWCTSCSPFHLPSYRREGPSADRIITAVKKVDSSGCP